MPTLVTGLQGKRVVQVAAGNKSNNHTICTTSDGSVFTWGDGACGELGLGNETNALVPTPVTGALQNGTVMQIAAGLAHSACMTNWPKMARCTWGENGEGQLGVADADIAYFPTLVAHQCNFADVLTHVYQLPTFADGTVPGQVTA